MNIRGSALAALTLLIAAMPLDAENGLEQFDQSRSDTAEWTISVYLDADNDLFATEANVLTTQSSYTGSLEQYRFVLDGDVLRLQDGAGGLYVYQRLQ